MFGGSEPAPEQEAETEGVPDVSMESAEAEEDSAGVSPEVSEPDRESSAEISVVVPIVPEDVVEDSAEEEETTPKPVKETAKMPPGPSCYTLLPGDSNALCVMKLEDGSARVLRSLVVAMDGSVFLDGEVLSGNGLIWMGQGSLTPVAVRYREGMTVRIDRVAVRPVEVVNEACGIGSVPSLCKFYGGGNDSSILMFVTGRLKKLTVTPGLKVRGECVVMADPKVSFVEEESGFLSLSGEGMVIISG